MCWSLWKSICNTQCAVEHHREQLLPSHSGHFIVEFRVAVFASAHSIWVSLHCPPAAISNFSSIIVYSSYLFPSSMLAAGLQPLVIGNCLLFRMALINHKFDEVRSSGDMLPTATSAMTSSREFYIVVC